MRDRPQFCGRGGVIGYDVVPVKANNNRHTASFGNITLSFSTDEQEACKLAGREVGGGGLWGQNRPIRICSIDFLLDPIVTKALSLTVLEQRSIVTDRWTERY